MSTKVKRVPKGRAPDIARVEQDTEAQAWNVVVDHDDYEITLAATDKDGAELLRDCINDAPWMVVNFTGRRRT